jgi:hypothetical protein
MQARRLKTGFLAFALACFSMACPVTSERFIVGTYRAESPCSDITLVVSRDHSFAQSVHTHAGGANQVSGKWTIDEKGWITFKPFLDFLNDDQGRQLEAAFFRPEVLPRGITMGPVVIKCSDSSHQIDYVK